MATYFVTGATGFIGRRLVGRLLGRPDQPTVRVLVRPGSRARLARLAAEWPGGERLVEVVGDLTRQGLGLAEHDRAALRGVDHVVHLGALYDLTADEEANRRSNVDGTAHLLDLAADLGAGWFHHVSSVAVAGDHRGRFTEDDLDTGQGFPTPYHATKFAAERLVRSQDRVRWRVYRPSVVVGDSRTGEMDKIDGPYFFFPLFAALARLGPLPRLTRLLPLVVPELGATNIVPVDYVVDAMDHLIHADQPSGSTFHLVNPRPQPLTEVYDAWAAAAGAPRVTAAPSWWGDPLARAARAVSRPVAAVGGAVERRLPRSLSTRRLLDEIGIPVEVVRHMSFPSVFDDTRTRKALAGSGLRVPPLSDYADVLWRYWAERLDPNRARRPHPDGPLVGRRIVITGASSGIGRATALAVARLGAVPLLVARRAEELERVRAEIEADGGVAHCYPCDLTDGEAVDALVKRMVSDQTADGGGIDMLVNNAGRSIRRPLRQSRDRLHDFERTMAINYFGPVRLVLGLLPHMASRRFGHVVNISTQGLQVGSPRYSAYLASKAALDAFSRVAAAELLGAGITFTTVLMPLVRTPMIKPTVLYERFPAATPEQAAQWVVEALTRRPKRVSRPLGTVAQAAYAVAPKAVDAVMHLVFRALPDSSPRETDRK
ncbi:Short-chain dehydrogenase [Streptoalloteichus tenebrarius]|uniref:Short-chain dehydrogenase n=1 Tax=Streptoalloteichus tenebrarius (strain ATCC 17920 / DSM 40477 / JCM 4838 / CBS 697.72 / NBRC 16177 / NCIMB 11028 / NRRL B-12390 / A12253. 1 / ISP 5477) TaxID=1933 RepID=A0ABT1I393_STRSD|nr:SDR family oxidoreductase [Streptoalloteichus tenebrarius]MCP2262259.1 Short-chain dehydrogenase [Streptoalloteichus tenebrarius]BFF00761.1 SDR family oxidoreductase [Streptoalloteichus tenebrarius]